MRTNPAIGRRFGVGVVEGISNSMGEAASATSLRCTSAALVSMLVVFTFSDDELLPSEIEPLMTDAAVVGVGVGVQIGAGVGSHSSPGVGNAPLIEGASMIGRFPV